ncbi:hypothetical protein LTR78_007185 [Recurvomyces mirabilis]|uniref:FAD-binding FR-type domain-containing protein n=1 Tax=Recurvomyces mirabilis TaxID=574656 RepID=A0AAE0WJG5_9PEZI|nr:hypothetical protein LTR78_007185 [Recurvomyces mirabilis]KAK5155572.1 hypothetical protein LTS14_005833 [Recurvomyces mirabilis]
MFALGLPLGWVLRSTAGDDGQIAKPTEFVKYKLVDKTEVSTTCAIFTLRSSGGAKIDHRQVHDSCALTSVQFKQPQLQIARSYTVLPPTKDQSPDDLRFLIRKERNGEVSGYLHRLRPEAEIEVRGPGVDYILPEDVGEVVFLAGGTGIAPAMQVAHRLAGKASVHVLWASRQREDSLGGVSDTKAQKSLGFGSSLFSWRAARADPTEASVGNVAATNAIVEQMQDLKHAPGSQLSPSTSLVIDYFVDEEDTFIQAANVAQIIESERASGGSRLILVSGPEGFVKHWAGQKEWVGGKEVQGPLGGVLATLNHGNWQVVKL